MKCQKCGQDHGENQPCPVIKVEANPQTSDIKRQTGCCGVCGTYHSEPEERCPRANR